MFTNENAKFGLYVSIVAGLITGVNLIYNHSSGNIRDTLFPTFGLTCWIVITLIILVKKSIEKAVPVLFVYLSVLCWYWIFYGGRDGFGVFWTLIIPVCIYYEFSFLHATIICGTVFAEQVIFLWTPLSRSAYQYDRIVHLWAPMLYGIIMLSSAYMKIQNEKLQRELEELVIKAEQANREKTDFLSNASHDIRTPINTILGMTELLLMESQEENVLEYAAVVDSAGKTLISVIKDVLDISKIEKQDYEIAEKLYRLSDLIRDCYGLIIPRCMDNNNKFDIVCDPSMPELLYGDMEHLRQILINLLTNAAKYTFDGEITLDIEGEVSDDNLNMVISVKDTGEGIKEEYLDNLLKRYDRLGKEKSNIEGTGLGLVITQKLIDLLGGKMEVSSVYGQGSTFTVRVSQKIMGDGAVGNISLSDRSNIIKKAKTHRTYTAEGKRILVVDDVENNIKLVKHQLKNSLATIDTASNGFEAIECAKKNHYDIIYLDKMMPEMDGIETLNKLMEIPGFSIEETPVIMLTADAATETRELALQRGFTDFLTKPVSIKELENTLKRYIK